MVLVPVLYNNINLSTFNTYISSRPGYQPSSTHIRATMFLPGETPTEPRTCAVILSSEENTNQLRRSPTAHLRGYILARGNTHQPRIYTATQCGCLRASGASQMGNPLHDEYVFPVLSVPTASRSLLGRISPFWWEVPTHHPDSSSMCEICRDRLTTRTISVKNLSHHFLCVGYTTYSSE